MVAANWGWPKGAMQVSPALRVCAILIGMVSFWVAGRIMVCGAGVPNLEGLGAQPMGRKSENASRASFRTYRNDKPEFAVLRHALWGADESMGFTRVLSNVVCMRA